MPVVVCQVPPARVPPVPKRTRWRQEKEEEEKKKEKEEEEERELKRRRLDDHLRRVELAEKRVCFACWRGLKEVLSQRTVHPRIVCAVDGRVLRAAFCCSLLGK